MKYNLKLVDWKNEDVDKIVKRAEKLSAIKDDDCTFKEIAIPIDPDSDTSDPYNACIMVWKEYEEFAVMMLLGYDCGDEIFTEVQSCSQDDSEKLKSIINEMYQKYHDEEKLEKIISEKMDEEEG